MSAISWWRSWHGAPTDHKWPVIAARSGVKVGIVSAIVWALLDYASQQEERGSIAGFDTEEYAIYSGFSEDEIKSVMKAMEDKNILKDGRFVNWEKRQPKREDDSNERVRKHREMKRSVTQCNAPEKEKDTESDKDTDTEKEEEKECNADADPFDAFQRVIEGKGILVTGEADIRALNEIIGCGATKDDILAGITWKADNNGGKAIRYVSQIIGPTKTAMAKRLQAGGNGTVKEFEGSADGRVRL